MSQMVTGEQMQSRIDTVLADLLREQRKALVPYLPIGFPHPDMSLRLLHALVEGGADMIELGVPFSDPMADGPVIQRATELALREGMTLKGVLSIAAQFRETNQSTPLVMMTYANPIESMGWPVFFAAAAESGIDGVLLVDVPVDEVGELRPLAAEHGLQLIHLVAPTSRDERVRQLAKVAQGFVYYVALKGVTGANTLNIDEVNSHVVKVKSMLSVPVLVGFGIVDGLSAKAVSAQADGAIVGTAIVRVIEQAQDSGVVQCAQNVTDFVKTLRSALDSDKVTF